MDDKIILREIYNIGDISYFKNDYKINSFNEKGEETENHIIFNTSQEVNNFLEDSSVELITTTEKVEVLKGGNEIQLPLIGKKDAIIIPDPLSGNGFPLEELNIGDIWEREINLPYSGTMVPLKILYTLEGIEEVHDWLCARIKLENKVVIPLPGDDTEIEQIREASGYSYIGLEDGKLIKATSYIHHNVISDGEIKRKIVEELVIDLIDFDWN